MTDINSARVQRRQWLRYCASLVLSGAAVSLTSKSHGAVPEGGQRPAALIIGNARYGFPGSALRNPSNDAKWVAQGFEGRGFDVTRLTDLTAVQMGDAVTRFAAQNRQRSVVVFYFAGHAVSVDGVNYLFGVDLPVPLTTLTIAQAQQHGLALRRISLALNRAGIRARILVMDACRTVLTRGGPPPTLVRSVPAGGELIAYSTQPGATAEDGFGEAGLANSPYAYFFGQGLVSAVGDLPVEFFFKQLTADVQVATAARQVPHYESSLVGSIRLGGIANASTMASPPATRKPGGSKRGESPVLGRDLIRIGLAEWEREIEQGARHVDVARATALRKRASAGDVIAMTTLGLIEETGVPGRPNLRQAATWYRRAALKHFAPAQTYLGELLATGRGVPKDMTEAQRLFKAAAAAGHNRAVLDLIDLQTRDGDSINTEKLGTTILDLLELQTKAIDPASVFQR